MTASDSTGKELIVSTDDEDDINDDIDREEMGIDDDYESDLDEKESSVSKGKKGKVVIVLVFGFFLYLTYKFIFVPDKTVQQEEEQVQNYISAPAKDQENNTLTTVLDDDPEEAEIKNLKTIEIPSPKQDELGKDTSIFTDDEQEDIPNIFFEEIEEENAKQKQIMKQKQSEIMFELENDQSQNLDAPFQVDEVMKQNTKKINNNNDINIETQNQAEEEIIEGPNISGEVQQEVYGAPMMMMNGGAGLSDSDEMRQQIQNTSVATVKATRIERPYMTIAQGKIIDVVLETAINTTLKGNLRGVLVRDVYAESGSRILLPRGSRVIGTYQSDAKQNQVRVAIVWKRIITPDGRDIIINAPATDQFGRSGIEGEVDNKFFGIISKAMLVSLLSVGSSVVVDAVSGKDNKIQITEKTDGSQNVVGSSTALALKDMVQNLAGSGKKIFDTIIDDKPIITIPQGTRIKIFVNQDLIVPTEQSLGKGVRIIW